MFLLSDTELHMPARLWVELCDELNRRTENWHESGAFLLGRVEGGRRFVEQIVFYDDLDPHAYDSGVVILRADSFGPLWTACREHRREVVADVHLHAGGAGQSAADRENPMIAQKRHIAMILPNFARAPIDPRSIGLFEYRGRHLWRDLGNKRIARHLKIGI